MGNSQQERVIHQAALGTRVSRPSANELLFVRRRITLIFGSQEPGHERHFLSFEPGEPLIFVGMVSVEGNTYNWTFLTTKGLAWRPLTNEFALRAFFEQAVSAEGSQA